MFATSDIVLSRKMRMMHVSTKFSTFVLLPVPSFFFAMCFLKLILFVLLLYAFVSRVYAFCFTFVRFCFAFVRFCAKFGSKIAFVCSCWA